MLGAAGPRGSSERHGCPHLTDLAMLAVVEGPAALALYESTAEVWSGAKRRGTLGGGRWLAGVAGVERTTVSCESDAALVASGGASQGRLPCKSAQWLVIYRGARCDD